MHRLNGTDGWQSWQTITLHFAPDVASVISANCQADNHSKCQLARLFTHLNCRITVKSQLEMKTTICLGF